MDQGPLVTWQVEEGARLVNAFDQYAPVKAAFWMKKHEKRWYLYLALDGIEEKGTREAYHEVGRLTVEPPSPLLDRIEVRFIDSNDPLVKDINARMAEFSHGRPMRYQGTMLGGVYFQDAYVYPTPAPVPI